MKHMICIFLSFFALMTVRAQDTLILNLEQCRQQALECSKDLHFSANVLQQAELTQKSMFTNFFPQVGGSAMMFTIEDQHLIDEQMANLELQMRGAYMCGFTLQQPLFAGGKIVNGHRLTKVGIGVAKEQLLQQRAQTFADVENTYWTYVAVLSKERLIDEYFHNLDTLLLQVEGSVAIGMATDYDLLQVLAARSNLDYQQQRIQGGVTLCRLSLSRLVGINADSIVILPDTTLPAAILPTLCADFHNRPEMRLLQYAVDAGNLMVKMKRADYLPTIGIGLSYFWIGNTTLQGGLSLSQLGSLPITLPEKIPLIDKTFNIHTPPMLAVSLSIPITKWWQGSYEIHKVKLEAQNNCLEQEKNTELLRLEVQQAIHNIEAGYALINSSELALVAAKEQLRVAKNRYDVDMIPLSEMLNAHANYSQAESNYIEAHTQYLIYLAEYRRVTGNTE